MLFEPGTPANTIATVPTRSFRFVIDPPLLSQLVMYPLRGIASLINDLASTPHGLTITLVYPDYLAERRNTQPPSLLEGHVCVAETDADIPPYRLSEEVPLEKKSPNARAALALVALANAVQADGIVTDSEFLVGARHPLYQHHRVRLIPPAEFGDVLERCAHGHGIFWSATEPSRNYPQDVYYQLLHPKGRKMARWFNRVSSSLTPPDHHENVRNATLNRYGFILYSRDMVRFYELQLDHFTRRGLYRRFGGMLAY